MSFIASLLARPSARFDHRSSARARTSSQLLPLLSGGLFALVTCLSGCSSDGGVSSSKDPSSESDEDEQDDVAVDAGVRDAGKDAGKDAGRDAGKDTGTLPSIKVDSGAEVEGCGQTRAEAELGRGPVDIIITMDTSLSMAPQVCNVSTNLTAFAAGVGDSSHVVSVYDMGVLGLATAGLCGNPDPLAATPLAMDATRYLHKAVGVDSWNALTQVNAQFDSYKDFLRPDAATHIIVVTDDQSDPLRGGMLGADFKAAMEQKLGHEFFFHAIVADGQNGCLGSGIGTEYLSLADATGGEKLSICAPDWSVVFKELEAAVVSSAPIPCDFEIPELPQGENLDPEAVQVVFAPPGQKEMQFPRAASQDQCGDQNAWHYDDPSKPTRVELCPAACESVKQGGEVNVAFGCAPDLVQ